MKPILLIATFLLSLSLSAEDSLYNISIKDIDNKTASLKKHKGKVLKRFSPRTKPDASEVTKAIEAALK